MRAVRANQPLRSVHDLLQQLVRIANGGDLGGQLLQRALRLDPQRQLRRLLPVGDGGGGMVAKGPQQADLCLAERCRPVGIGAHGADHPLPRHQGRDRHRAHARRPHDLIGHLQVLEALVDRVVVGDGQLAPADGRAEHPDPDGQAQVTDQAPGATVGDARVVGKAQHLAGLVDQVDHRAVCLQQAGHLRDGALQQLGFGRHAAEDTGSNRGLARAPLRHPADRPIGPVSHGLLMPMPDGWPPTETYGWASHQRHYSVIRLLY